MTSEDRIEASPAAGATRREWIGLSVLTLATVVYAMDLTVLHLAIPRLSADLQPSSAQLLWIIDIYGFLVAGCLITMGTLGDRIGRRRLLMIGAAAFAAASVLAALSTTAEMLIVSRALMGIAGATLAPSTLSLVFNMFTEPKQRSVAIGVWIGGFSAGGAIGPLLGGVLLERYWWGSVFLLALPVMGALLVLGPRVLPEFKDPDAGRLDPVSAAMSLASLLSIIYALKQAAQDGFGVEPLAWITAGLVVGALFIRRQRAIEDPMIDLALFRIPALNASLITYLLSIFVAFGYFLFIAQYLQLVVGLSPLEAGWWSLPSGVGFIVGSQVSPHVIHRARPSVIMGVGLAVSAVTLAALAQVDGGTSSLGLIVVATTVMSLALSPVVTLSTELIVGSAPPERAGAASGISETSAELGGALGIAVLGSIGTAIYRSEVARSLPDLPPAVGDVARDTLGGAVGVAAELDPQTGAAVLDAARGAFMQGMRVTAILSAIVALGVAILAAALLRRVRARPSEDGGGVEVVVESQPEPEPVR